MSDLIEETPEDKLRRRLAEIDAGREAAVATADAALAASEAAQQTAGQEFDAAAEAADEQVAESIAAYEAQLQQWDSRLTAAATATSEIGDPMSAETEIAAIGSVDDLAFDPQTIDPVTVTTGGAPDCDAAAVEAAINEAVANAQAALNAAISEAQADINAALTQIREVRDEIVAALAALNAAVVALDVDKIREALTAVKEASQVARDQMPSAAEALALEAEKTAVLGQLDSLFQL